MHSLPRPHKSCNNNNNKEDFIEIRTDETIDIESIKNHEVVVVVVVVGPFRDPSFSAGSWDLLRIADKGGFIYIRRDLQAAQSRSLFSRESKSIQYVFKLRENVLHCIVFFIKADSRAFQLLIELSTSGSVQARPSIRQRSTELAQLLRP